MTTIEEFDKFEFGKNLRSLRKKKGLRIKDLEELSGVSNAYLSQLETAKRGRPSPEILKKLAPHLGISYTELMKLAGHINEDIDTESLGLLELDNLEDIIEYTFSIMMNNMSKNGIVDEKWRLKLLVEASQLSEESEFFNDENLKSIKSWRTLFDSLTFQEKLELVTSLKEDLAPYEKDETYKEDEIEYVNEQMTVPILGYIAAGQPILAEEHIIDYEMMPGNFEGEHFMLEVKGDSMIGSRIFPGDKVLVKVQPEVETGEIAVVNVNGNDATLKKVKRYEDGSVWLISSNEKYAPIPLNENSRVIGKVVRVIFEP